MNRFFAAAEPSALRRETSAVKFVLQGKREHMTTNWIEITIEAEAAEAELVAEVLRDFGYQGVSLEQQGIMPEMYDDGEAPPAESYLIRIYLPDDVRVPDQRRQIEAELASRGLPTPNYDQVRDQDWAEAWKAHYHPTRIGRHILVRPIWEEAEVQPGDVVIALDPGMAFGTGTHPTTQLCLASLEDHMRPGLDVLDLGSGSGILAIAAAKLGAAKVLAVDNDVLSVDASQENAEVNGVGDKVTALHGSLETVRGSARRFDLIVVNILARIIVQMSGEGLGQIVRPGGVAIFSGLIRDQLDEVTAALQQTGLEGTHVHYDPDSDWVAVEARRPSEKSS
jgi:ribosomal protein L11 methyltransferase